jgi:hypothetical protein
MTDVTNSVGFPFFDIAADYTSYKLQLYCTDSLLREYKCSTCGNKMWHYTFKGRNIPGIFEKTYDELLGMFPTRDSERVRYILHYYRTNPCCVDEYGIISSDGKPDITKNIDKVSCMTAVIAYRLDICGRGLTYTLLDNILQMKDDCISGYTNGRSFNTPVILSAEPGILTFTRPEIDDGANARYDEFGLEIVAEVAAMRGVELECLLISSDIYTRIADMSRGVKHNAAPVDYLVGSVPIYAPARANIDTYSKFACGIVEAARENARYAAYSMKMRGNGTHGRLYLRIEGASYCIEVPMWFCDSNIRYCMGARTGRALSMPGRKILMGSAELYIDICEEKTILHKSDGYITMKREHLIADTDDVILTMPLSNMFSYHYS